jgi:RNase P/RNase MRP subunit p29
VIRRANHDLVDVAGEVRGETPKAYRFYDGAREVWLPKSQCEWDAEARVMTLEEWLAMDKGLI